MVVKKKVEKEDGLSEASSSMGSDDINDPGEYFHPPLIEMISETESSFHVSTGEGSRNNSMFDVHGPVGGRITLNRSIGESQDLEHLE